MASTFATLAKKRRAELGLSLREVARKATAKGHPITHVALSDYERGRSLPDLRRIPAVAAGLDLPVEMIVEAVRRSDSVDTAELPEYKLLDEGNRAVIRAQAQALLARQRRLDEVERVLGEIHARLGR